MKKYYVLFILATVFLSACNSPFPSVRTVPSNPNQTAHVQPVADSGHRPSPKMYSSVQRGEEMSDFNVIIQTGIESGTLNFRAGPGVNYLVLGQLLEGDTVKVLYSHEYGSGGSWYQVDIDGVRGWINARHTTNKMLIINQAIILV